jgi:sec-independent protein translocase protein TatC
MGKNPQGRMPLIEHFTEFRSRLFKSAIFIAAFGIFGWFIYDKVLNLLSKPVCALKGRASLSECGTLYINGVLGPIDLKFKISLIIGLILASPFWLYQLWAFISPALHKKERRNSLIFIFFAVPFFSIGAYIGYRILPFAVKMLLGFTPSNIENLIKFDDYLNFVSQLILVFGIAFELPVFLSSLNFAGVLSGRSILKPWRFAIFGIMLFAAIFTPTGDPFTMLLLAIPLIILYFLSCGISLLNDRRRNNRANGV